MKYALEGILAKHSANAKIEFLPLLSSEIGEKPAARALCGQINGSVIFFEKKIRNEKFKLNGKGERGKKQKYTKEKKKTVRQADTWQCREIEKSKS